MEVRLGLKRLRAKALRLHREYEAMLVISNTVTKAERKHLDFEKEKISKVTKSNLRQIIVKLNAAIAEFRTDFGFKVPNSELVDLLQRIESGPKGMPPRMNKAWIEELCTGYSKYYSSIFDVLPAHAFIQIDPGWYREKRGELSWYWLEAAVFEDMCALFNLAKEYHAQTSDSTSNKKVHKTMLSLFRATVITAFHFVEAYLNGLAFDHWDSKRTNIDKKTASVLLDWDFENNKPQYLSLRDKILKYPRLILGTQHSPLQESNCPELKYIVERGKLMRDAITHVSPKREFEFSESTNGSLFYEVKFGEVEQIVDSAVELVRKLERAVYGNDKRLFWLQGRTASGLFSDDVFV